MFRYVIETTLLLLIAAPRGYAARSASPALPSAHVLVFRLLKSPFAYWDFRLYYPSPCNTVQGWRVKRTHSLQTKQGYRIVCKNSDCPVGQDILEEMKGIKDRPHFFHIDVVWTIQWSPTILHPMTTYHSIPAWAGGVRWNVQLAIYKGQQSPF